MNKSIDYILTVNLPLWCVTIRVSSDFVLYWIKQSTLGLVCNLLNELEVKLTHEIDMWNWHMKLTRENENVVLDFDYFNPIRQSANRRMIEVFFGSITLQKDLFNLCFWSLIYICHVRDIELVTLTSRNAFNFHVVLYFDYSSRIRQSAYICMHACVCIYIIRKIFKKIIKNTKKFIYY